MKQKIVIILDLNGVVQGMPKKQLIKFGLGQVLALRLSPITLWAVIKKVQHYGTDKFTENAPYETAKVIEAEKRFIENFYEAGQAIKIPFLPHAKAAVEQMLADGLNVHICSANKYSPSVDKRYRDFLIKTFAKYGHFVDITFTGAALDSKLPYYKRIKSQYPKACIVVADDSDWNIKAAKSVGLETAQIGKDYPSLSAWYAALNK